MTVAGTAAGALGAGAAPSGASASPLLRERVRLLAEQSAGAALSTFVGAILIGVVLATEASKWEVCLWIGAYLGPALLRVRYSRRILRGLVEPDAAALGRYFRFALFNGAWTGALPLAFFADLSVEARAALTVVSLLSLTAGAATFASYRTGYLCVLALALPPLVFDWALLGGRNSWIVVATLVVFGGLMVRLSGHLAEVFVRSVEIRFERERVVEQLRLEKAQTELAREKAEEANRAKSRFLASASHDLRQPVHALGLFSGVLAATAETERHQAIARHIAAASDSLKKLLDNLLDISRLDAGVVQVAVQPVDVAAMVERLAAEAAGVVAGRGIEVVAQADVPPAVLDPVHVERCVRNLVQNACKFTGSGRIAIAASRQGAQLALSVTDTGIGIPAAQLALVFEEFYQVGNTERDQSKGLGLGLSIVARLAAMMGGEVRVDSVPGQGSTFTLLLPFVAAQAGPVTAADAPVAAVDLAGRRVLVIDDEALVRASMREQLAAWGAQVDEADGLAQALALVPRRDASGDPGRQAGAEAGGDEGREAGAGAGGDEGWQAGGADGRGVGTAAQTWDLCLCDLRLRDGEDGVQTAQRLRVTAPRLPVILVSGDTAPARIEQAARSGLPLLHKPVGPAELAAAIRTALQVKAA